MLCGTPDVFCIMLHFDGDALGSQKVSNGKPSLLESYNIGVTFGEILLLLLIP